MGRKNHNPSIARKILRNLKEGNNPESLLTLTKSITDPYYTSISFFNLGSFESKNIEKSKTWFNSGFKKVDKVNQAWRRVELLGKISKILKRVESEAIKEKQFALLLSYSSREKTQDSKDFFVQSSKNFPTSMLMQMLQKTVRLKEHEFAASKAIIRSWTNRGKPTALINQVLESESKIKIKLLGYIHLQFSKHKIEISPTALELALTIPGSDKHLNYLVRICSNSQDLDTLSELNLTPEILLALAVRADRKGYFDHYRKNLLAAKKAIDSLEPSDTKVQLLSKHEKAKEGIIGTKESQIQSFDYPLVKKGTHTIGLFNTYGGNWNHPHFKAVYKASKLCSAFDLDLALIGFPEISSDKIIKEVNKEMRVTKHDFLGELFYLKRIFFFETDIDESLVGHKVITTSNPDNNKTKLPSGKLCMIMGLGPKGLPQSYIKKSKYHFELTGSNVAFETGIAMGAISSELGSLT